MTLQIEFTPREEAWLARQAEREGISPAEIIRRMVDAQLALNAEPEQSTPILDAENAAAIAMLDRWVLEDATDDPEEILKVDEEVEELKQNLNANRAATGERLVFP